jgi:hypothetical protein
VDITRITDHSLTGPIIGDSGRSWEESALWRHKYSSFNPWNADGSILYLSKGLLFLDADAGYVSMALYRPYGLWYWSHINPDEAFDLVDDLVRVVNVRTGDVVHSAALPGYSDLLFNTRSAPSYDDERVAISAVRESDGERVALVVEPWTGEILHEVVFSDHGYGTDCGPTWDEEALSEYKLRGAMISPSGDYLVLFGCNRETSSLRDTGRWFEVGGTSGVYEDGYVGQQELNDDIECIGGHADLGMDAGGNDIWFGTCKTGGGVMSELYGGSTVGLDLTTGEVFVLLDVQTSHSSGRHSALPGYGIGSSFGEEQGSIYRFPLDGLTTADYLVWTYSLGIGGYDAETHAVASPDGSRIVFASDWSGQAEAYVAHVDVTLPR